MAPFSQYMVTKVEKDVAKPNVENHAEKRNIRVKEGVEERSVENKYNN